MQLNIRVVGSLFLLALSSSKADVIYDHCEHLAFGYTVSKADYAFALFKDKVPEIDTTINLRWTIHRQAALWLAGQFNHIPIPRGGVFFNERVIRGQLTANYRKIFSPQVLVSISVQGEVFAPANSKKITCHEEQIIKAGGVLDIIALPAFSKFSYPIQLTAGGYSRCRGSESNLIKQSVIVDDRLGVVVKLSGEYSKQFTWFVPFYYRLHEEFILREHPVENTWGLGGGGEYHWKPDTSIIGQIVYDRISGWHVGLKVRLARVNGNAPRPQSLQGYLRRDIPSCFAPVLFVKHSLAETVCGNSDSDSNVEHSVIDSNSDVSEQTASSSESITVVNSATVPPAKSYNSVDKHNLGNSKLDGYAIQSVIKLPDTPLKNARLPKTIGEIKTLYPGDMGLRKLLARFFEAETLPKALQDLIAQSEYHLKNHPDIKGANNLGRFLKTLWLMQDIFEFQPINSQNEHEWQPIRRNNKTTLLSPSQPFPRASLMSEIGKHFDITNMWDENHSRLTVDNITAMAWLRKHPTAQFVPSVLDCLLDMEQWLGKTDREALGKTMQTLSHITTRLISHPESTKDNQSRYTRTTAKKPKTSLVKPTFQERSQPIPVSVWVAEVQDEEKKPDKALPPLPPVVNYQDQLEAFNANIPLKLTQPLREERQRNLINSLWSVCQERVDSTACEEITVLCQQCEGKASAMIRLFLDHNTVCGSVLRLEEKEILQAIYDRLNSEIDLINKCIDEIDVIEASEESSAIKKQQIDKFVSELYEKFTGTTDLSLSSVQKINTLLVEFKSIKDADLIEAIGRLRASYRTVINNLLGPLLEECKTLLSDCKKSQNREEIESLIETVDQLLSSDDTPKKTSSTWLGWMRSTPEPSSISIFELVKSIFLIHDEEEKAWAEQETIRDYFRLISKDQKLFQRLEDDGIEQSFKIIRDSYEKAQHKIVGLAIEDHNNQEDDQLLLDVIKNRVGCRISEEILDEWSDICEQELIHVIREIIDEENPFCVFNKNMFDILFAKDYLKCSRQWQEWSEEKKADYGNYKVYLARTRWENFQEDCKAALERLKQYRGSDEFFKSIKNEITALQNERIHGNTPAGRTHLRLKGTRGVSKGRASSRPPILAKEQSSKTSAIEDSHSMGGDDTISGSSSENDLTDDGSEHSAPQSRWRGVKGPVPLKSEDSSQEDLADGSTTTDQPVRGRKRSESKGGAKKDRETGTRNARSRSRKPDAERRMSRGRSRLSDKVSGNKKRKQSQSRPRLDEEGKRHQSRSHKSLIPVQDSSSFSQEEPKVLYAISGEVFGLSSNLRKTLEQRTEMVKNIKLDYKPEKNWYWNDEKTQRALSDVFAQLKLKQDHLSTIAKFEHIKSNKHLRPKITSKMSSNTHLVWERLDRAYRCEVLDREEDWVRKQLLRICKPLFPDSSMHTNPEVSLNSIILRLRQYDQKKEKLQDEDMRYIEYAELLYQETRYDIPTHPKDLKDSRSDNASITSSRQQRPRR